MPTAGRLDTDIKKLRFMAFRFLLKRAVLFTFLCHITYCEKDFLETLKVKVDDPPELINFMNSLLQVKDDLKKIRDVAKQNQNDHIISKIKANNVGFNEEEFYDDYLHDFYDKPIKRQALTENDKPVNDVYPYSNNDKEYEDTFESIESDQELSTDDEDKINNKRKKRSIHQHTKMLNNNFHKNTDLIEVMVLPRSRTGVRRVPGTKIEDYELTSYNEPNNKWNKAKVENNRNYENNLQELVRQQFSPKRNPNTDPKWQKWTKNKIQSIFKKNKKNKHADVNEYLETLREEKDLNEKNSNKGYYNQYYKKRKSHGSESDHDPELLHRAMHIKHKYRILHQNPSHAVNIENEVPMGPKYLNEFMSNNIESEIDDTKCIVTTPRCKECNKLAVVYQAKPDIKETQPDEGLECPATKRVQLQDVDEPTSAIEQHQLSTSLPEDISQSCSNRDLFGLTLANTIKPFLIQENRNMIHGITTNHKLLKIVKVFSPTNSEEGYPSTLSSILEIKRKALDKDSQLIDTRDENFNVFQSRKIKSVNNSPNEPHFLWIYTGDSTERNRIKRSLPDLFGMKNDEDYSEDMAKDFKLPAKIEKERSMDQNAHLKSLLLLNSFKNKNSELKSTTNNKKRADDDEENGDIGAASIPTHYNKKNNLHSFKENEKLTDNENELPLASFKDLPNNSEKINNRCIDIDCQNLKIEKDHEPYTNQEHITFSTNAEVFKKEISISTQSKCVSKTTPTTISQTFHKKVTRNTPNMNQMDVIPPKEQANDDQLKMAFKHSITNISTSTDVCNLLTTPKKTKRSQKSNDIPLTKTLINNEQLDDIYTHLHTKHNENDFIQLPQIKEPEKLLEQETLGNFNALKREDYDDISHRIKKKGKQKLKRNQNDYDSTKLFSNTINKNNFNKYGKLVRRNFIRQEDWSKENEPYIKYQPTDEVHHLKYITNAMNNAPYENYIKLYKSYTGDNFNDWKTTDEQRQMKNDKIDNSQFKDQKNRRIFFKNNVDDSESVKLKRCRRNYMQHNPNILGNLHSSLSNYHPKIQERKAMHIIGIKSECSTCGTTTKSCHNSNNNLLSQEKELNPSLGVKAEANKGHCTLETGAKKQSENQGQLQEALSGQLASRIVDFTYKKLKKCEKLNRRFGEGLRRHYNYKDEMRGLDEFKNSETQDDIQHTECLLSQIMVVLNRIILDQVRRRTCKRLPPELRHYLVVITKPSREAQSSSDDSQVADEGYPLALVQCKKVKQKPPDNKQGEFLFNLKAANLEQLRDADEVKNKIAMIEGLLNKYKHMSKSCQVKVEGVEMYLQKHLTMLKCILKRIQQGEHLEAQCPGSEKSKRKYEVSKNSFQSVVRGKKWPNEPVNKHNTNIYKHQKSDLMTNNVILPNFHQGSLLRQKFSDDYHKNFHNHKFNILKNNYVSTVSDKYKKLVNAADVLRQKRNIQERLGKLFGSCKSRSLINENYDTIRSLNEENEDLDIGFESHAVTDSHNFDR